MVKLVNESLEKFNIVYRNIDLVTNKEDFFVHSHDYYEIYFYHKGDCKYIINEDMIDLQSHDIIIMNGSSLHGPAPEINTCYERSVIEFSADWIRPILDKLNVPELLTPFDKLSNYLLRKVDKQVHENILQLVNRLQLKQIQQIDLKKSEVQKRLLDAEITTLLIELLFIIYDLSKGKLNNIMLSNNKKTLHVNHVISWIDQHFQEEVTLDDVANSLHISKYYMARIFKDVTGFTVMQYLMQRRLVRAKYLLEMQSTKSILEIALDSGFESSSHFSRKFREFYRISPSAYRNEMRERSIPHVVH
ncbi:transcriptional regulator [Gracilibacillus boraciitolerans JCM 21714]|uniref:Transcriptional regulator n=1 Tax=Gracilibacillus boraciitolerans JCM 21714 TaxID=1298598 RepID=W4VLQ3_9BACI|nr:AraC family transcriptional regulator [Gracilibacillus boraciitolerans]GAE94310.1 transcriptional regulator [Gracilibacillus boraciitolerans JCM 21714]